MKAEKVEENNEACGPVQTRPESLHCLGLVGAELHIGPEIYHHRWFRHRCHQYDHQIGPRIYHHRWRHHRCHHHLHAYGFGVSFVTHKYISLIELITS